MWSLLLENVRDIIPGRQIRYKLRSFLRPLRVHLNSKQDSGYIHERKVTFNAHISLEDKPKMFPKQILREWFYRTNTLAIECSWTRKIRHYRRPLPNMHIKRAYWRNQNELLASGVELTVSSCLILPRDLEWKCCRSTCVRIGLQARLSLTKSLLAFFRSMSWMGCVRNG